MLLLRLGIFCFLFRERGGVGSWKHSQNNFRKKGAVFLQVVILTSLKKRDKSQRNPELFQSAEGERREKKVQTQKLGEYQEIGGPLPAFSK